MSRDPFDRLAKGEVKAMLEQAGTVETQVEVSSPVHYADLLFEPDPSKARALTEYGWFARIAAGGAAVFEFVHNTPNTEELLRCLRRAPTLHPMPSKSGSMRQWIFSSGVPRKALEELGFVRDEEWDAGVYRLPRGYRVTLFVISELPKIRATLLLRLLGANRTFEDAVVELLALPLDSPEHGVARGHVLDCLRSIRHSGRPLTDQEKELLMKSAHYMDIDELDAKLRAEGEAKGEAKGRVSLLQKQLKLKFPQASEQDLAPLASAKNEQLECWAERVLTAHTLEEIFAPLVDQEREPPVHYMDIEELDAKLRAEGEAKGEARGRTSLLRKLLKLKFPRASEQDLAPLASATNEQIECWAERVLTANTLEEIFA